MSWAAAKRSIIIRTILDEWNRRRPPASRVAGDPDLKKVVDYIDRRDRGRGSPRPMSAIRARRMNRTLAAIPLRSGVRLGSAQRDRDVPCGPAVGKSDAHHRRSVARNRRRPGARAGGRSALLCVLGAGGDCARALSTGMPALDSRDLETSQVSIFAVRAQARRAAQPHADDGGRQPPQDPPRPHGQHRPADHDATACAPTTTRSIASARRSWKWPARRAMVRATTPAGTRDRRRHDRRIPVAEDERHHQPQHVGQPAGRRSLDHAGRGQRRRSSSTASSATTCAPSTAICATTPLTLRVKDSRLVDGAFGQQSARRGVLALHPHGREQRPRGRVRHRHEHRRPRRDRQHPSGRKDSGLHIAFGNPYGAPHRRGLAFEHPHRCRRPPLRHLGGRPADHERTGSSR